jgi:hypothetical protein
MAEDQTHTEFEKARQGACKSGEPLCADLVPSGCVPSNDNTRADEKTWGLGYLLTHKPGSEISAELLERAKSLVLAVRGRVGVAKARALIYAVRTIYADFPQSWAAWDERSDYVARKPPDDKQLFHPDDLDKVGEWLGDCFDRRRTVMFLVPLKGFSGARLTHYHVPDLPGPGDPMMGSEELLRMFDVSHSAGAAKSPG